MVWFNWRRREEGADRRPGEVVAGWAFRGMWPMRGAAGVRVALLVLETWVLWTFSVR